MVLGSVVTLFGMLAVETPMAVTELVWEAPAGCPDGEALRRRVEAMVPGPASEARPLYVAGRLIPGQQARWRLVLTLRGPDLRDDRTIEADDCEALTGVVALLIAISMAPEVAGDRLPAAAVPVVPPVPPVPDMASAPPVGLPSPRRAAGEHGRSPGSGTARRGARVRGALRVGGGAEIGAIPRWTPGLTLVAGLLGRRWRVEVAATHAAGGVHYAAMPAVGGRMALWAGAARGCVVSRWRRLEFPACGGLELGDLRAVGSGVTTPRRAHALWLAAQFAPGVVWVPRRWFAVMFGLEVLVALRRPGFHVETLPELGRAGPVGLRTVVGVEYRFP